MDTVSQIRGSMGRPPLEEKDKIYFMKKEVKILDEKAGAPTSLTLAGQSYKSVK